MLPPTLNAVGQEVHNANIRIYPPELGSVLAKLKLNKNSAELTIMAK